VNAAPSRGTIVLRLWLLLVAAACSASSVQAHEVRPAYLEIRETAPGTFDVLWKVPARGEYRLSLHVRLPGECRGAPLHSPGRRTCKLSRYSPRAGTFQSTSNVPGEVSRISR